MTDEQFKNEMLYQASLAIFKAMLKKRVISGGQYAFLQKIMLEKYRPPIGSFLADMR